MAIKTGRTIGLALVRPSQQLGDEPFYHEFIAGIERILGTEGHSLLLQIVEDAHSEVSTYRRWASHGSVAGVILVDLSRDDARVDLVRDLGLPAIVVGDPESAKGLPSVWTGDASSMEVVVQRLYSLGHRALGRVSGPRILAHSQIRSETFLDTCRSLGLTSAEEEADYSEMGGQLATGKLMDRSNPPTALIFDDDLMAIGGLHELARRKVSVPDDVSVLAWDDSMLCQLSSPALSVMGHDVQLIGELAGQLILDVIEGRPSKNKHAPVARFVERQSSGPRKKSQ